MTQGTKVWGVVMGLLALTPAAWATPQVIHQNLQPGGFYVARVAPGSTVTLGEEVIVVGPKGEIVVGFDRNAPRRQVLKVCHSQGCSETVLKLKARTYVTQNVTKVPQGTVTPDPAQEKRVAEDNAATKAARSKAEAAARWRDAFTQNWRLPIAAPTSGVFGSRRTYNGEERSWHKGHDLAAKTGTPIKAPADGIVRLARDTFMSGNLVMLDHGGAVTSVYAHMDRMDVKVGDEVKAGDVIGKVGTTGRSSGPHLHWGMYWKNVPIDPILWVRK